MKRPQNSKTAVNDNNNDHLESIRSAYKRAREAYKNDKSNKDLKMQKSDAKKLLKEAEDEQQQQQAAATAAAVAESTTCSSSVDTKDDSAGAAAAAVAPSPPEEEQGSNTTIISSPPSSSSPNMKILEDAYQNALSAFKANKTNKDLRRAKTAARRALDNAIFATSSDNNGSKQLICMHCSKKFLFTTQEQTKYNAMGWTDLPKRCQPCKKHYLERGQQRDRTKLDGKKRNMCYAYQRGECIHGARCKFSHNPEHGGKKRSSTNDDDDEKNEGGAAAAVDERKSQKVVHHGKDNDTTSLHVKEESQEKRKKKKGEKRALGGNKE